MGFGNLLGAKDGQFGSVLGLVSGGAIGAVVSAAVGRAAVPKQTKEAVRGVNTDSKSKSGAQVTQTEVIPSSGQPSTTDSKKVDPTPIPKDTYRFGETAGNLVSDLFSTTTSAETTIYRGLQDPQDETLASINLTVDLGTNLDKSLNEAAQKGNFSGDIISGYSRFFLEGVAEAEQEKYQIVETFTAFYVFFYGKRPPIYKFSGSLLNDNTHKWTNDMKFFYENFFRGTKAVELGAQAVVAYDGKLVSGFILDMAVQQNAVLNKGASFSFDILVTDHVPMYFSSDINGLIQKKQEELAARALSISQQLALINKNIPPDKQLAANQVGVGKKRPSSVKKKNLKAKVVPVSRQSTAYGPPPPPPISFALIQNTTTGSAPAPFTPV